MTILFDDIQNLIGLESIHVEEQVWTRPISRFFPKISGLHVPWSYTFHHQVIYLSVCTLRMKTFRQELNFSYSFLFWNFHFGLFFFKLTVTRHG